MAVYVRSKIILAAELQQSDDELLSYVIDAVDDSTTRMQLEIAQFKNAQEVILRIGETIKSQPAERSDHLGYHQQRDEDKYRRRRCYKCGSEQHLANNCSQPTQERGSCFGCGSREHQRSDCPHQGEQIINCVGERSIESCFIDISVGNHLRRESWRAAIDTGSAISIVKRDRATSFKNEMDGEEVNKYQNYRGVNRSKVRVLGLLKLNVEFDGRQNVLQFKVVDNDTISFDVLLGRDFLEKMNCVLKILNYILVKMKKRKIRRN